jgi:hypothetical protein
MWVLSFVPDSFLLWIVNTILIAGLIGTFSSYFIRFIPPLIPYAGLVKTVGIVLLVAGVYLKGGYGVEMEWRARVAEVEAKLKIAEEQSAQANAELETKTRETIKYIRGRTEVVREFIDREVVKYDTKFMPGGICEIPREFIKAHNDAAEGPKK